MMERSSKIRHGWCAAACWLGALASAPAAADHHEFAFAVVPDTQTYTSLRPQIIDAQFRWIAMNRVTESIVYVAHLGDLKDVGACVNATLAWPDLTTPSTEWDIVRDAFDELDTAGIPYGVAPGNHDFDQRTGVFPADTGGCPNFTTERPLVGYNGEFPPATLSGLFGVNYGNRIAGSNEDNFVTLSSNGVDFLFINLGFQGDAPAAGSTDSIDWAETLVGTTYPNHIAIVNSHYLVDCNRSSTGLVVSSGSPCATLPDTYNQPSTYGSNIFDRLRAYPNLFMLIGGHRFGEAYKALDRTAEGFPPVHAVLANYQHLQYSATNFDTVNVPGPAGGTSGYFKLMRFDMDTMTVDLDSLSPALAAMAQINGSGSILPVLSNGNRPTTVFSPRDIDVTNPADLEDASGAPRLHTQTVSNLVNISFAGYAPIGTTTLIDFETRGDGVTPYASPGDSFPADEYAGVSFADSDPNPNFTPVNSINPVNVGTPITGHHVNIGSFAGVDTRLTLTFGPAVNAVGFDFATPDGEINVSVENGGVPVSQLDFVGNDEFTNLAGALYGAGRVDISGLGNFDTVIIEPTPNAVLVIDNLEFTSN